MVKSLICVPLKLENKTTGLLYLENNSSAGIFDKEKLEIIDMLTYQLAIMLENVEIYRVLDRLNRTLENKIKQRTREVERQKDEINSQKDEILAQRDMLVEQKNKIEEQNKSVTDSIRYASRIQQAIMPADELIRFFFPKHFILYLPRDIVSGDFYWIGQRDNKIILAVIDCTGHGVPGAFMSVLGSSLLNEIIGKIKPLYAHEILNELRDRIIISLHQTGTMFEAKDGMDLALCIFEQDSMNIQFAGAFNSLLIIRDTEMILIKGDQMPVGIGDKAGTSFTNHVLELQKGDSLYMFTDGFASQFGGPERKSLGVNRLKEWLAGMQDKIMFEQKTLLEDKFKEWKGLEEQIDDVLVMGIKI
jgi:serine phosphatase RsbU (regulator of sigma subunit)